MNCIPITKTVQKTMRLTLKEIRSKYNLNNTKTALDYVNSYNIKQAGFSITGDPVYDVKKDLPAIRSTPSKEEFVAFLEKHNISRHDLAIITGCSESILTRYLKKDCKVQISYPIWFILNAYVYLKRDIYEDLKKKTYLTN